MTMTRGPDGPIEVLVTGRGSPVTVFAHGLASSIDETRPFASGVTGTRVFLHFRGHGHSAAPPSAWTYQALRRELMSVVDAYDATRALGISLGAGALLLAALETPDRFERLVFVLPATIDTPRHDPAIQRMHRMADLIDSGSAAELAMALAAEQPAGARERPDVALWASKQAERLRSTAVSRALRELPDQHPLRRGADLSAISCPVLVLGQEGDDAHPAAVARELAERLPDAQLRIFDDAGLVWSHRAELRALIASFLNS